MDQAYIVYSFPLTGSACYCDPWTGKQEQKANRIVYNNFVQFYFPLFLFYCIGTFEQNI